MSATVTKVEPTIIHMRCYKEGTEEVHSHGGLTIAYREVLDPKEGTTVLFDVALARCKWTDNFCRYEGRRHALARLKNNYCRQLLVDIDQLDGLYDLMTEFANKWDQELTEAHEKMLEERAAQKEAKKAVIH